MENENKPEIRFKGFEGEWEEYELKDLCSLITKQTGFDYTAKIKPSLLSNYSIDSFPFIQNKDFESTNINLNTDFYIPKSIANNYPNILIDRPSILISISGKIGNVGLYQLSDKAFIGGAVGICKLNNESNGLIVLYKLLSNSGQKYFQSLIKASSHSNITVYDIRKIKVQLPNSNEEQIKIGNFFKNIDKLIAEHQQKHSKLKSLKKAMLDKMFPKEGQVVPEIRFKGFEGEWVKYNLGEISPVRGGFAFKSNEFKKGGVPILKISNILPTGEVGGNFDFYDEQPQDENFLLPNNSAVLAMSGATTGKVSILKFKENKKVYQNQRVGYFQDKNIVDYSFISILLRSPLFSNKMKAVLVAGAQPNVSPKEINAFEFYVPINSDEQQKIGSYFNNLDGLINNHDTQITKLQNIKKALLAKMFV